MRIARFDREDYGTFYDGRGTLIGHESRDVMRFLQAHPEFNGSIYFEREDLSGELDVTEVFFPEEAAVCGIRAVDAALEGVA